VCPPPAQPLDNEADQRSPPILLPWSSRVPGSMTKQRGPEHPQQPIVNSRSGRVADGLPRAANQSFARKSTHCEGPWATAAGIHGSGRGGCSWQCCFAVGQGGHWFECASPRRCRARAWVWGGSRPTILLPGRRGDVHSELGLESGSPYRALERAVGRVEAGSPPVPAPRVAVLLRPALVAYHQKPDGKSASFYQCHGISSRRESTRIRSLRRWGTSVSLQHHLWPQCPPARAASQGRTSLERPSP